LEPRQSEKSFFFFALPHIFDRRPPPSAGRRDPTTFSPCRIFSCCFAVILTFRTYGGIFLTPSRARNSFPGREPTRLILIITLSFFVFFFDSLFDLEMFPSSTLAAVVWRPNCSSMSPEKGSRGTSPWSTGRSFSASAVALVFVRLAHPFRLCPRNFSSHLSFHLSGADVFSPRAPFAPHEIMRGPHCAQFERKRTACFFQSGRRLTPKALPPVGTRVEDSSLSLPFSCALRERMSVSARFHSQKHDCERPEPSGGLGLRRKCGLFFSPARVHPSFSVDLSQTYRSSGRVSFGPPRSRPSLWFAIILV